MALHQDERGVLWIATLDGLAHFDGETIETVAAPDAPRHGALRSMAPRPGGGFYVGGASKVHSYDHHTWTVLAADDGADALASRGHELWRLDRQGRASYISEEKPPWIQVALPAGAPLAVAITSRAEELFLATPQEVYRRTADGWSSLGRPQGPAGSPKTTITALLTTRDGSLWLGTDSSYLFALAPGANEWRTLPLPDWQGGRVRALAEDLRGRIWAGGLRGGLAFGNDVFTVLTTENGLHQDGILALLPDREGSLWIAFNGHGLQQWLGESWTHRNRWEGETGSRHRHPIFGISPSHDGGFYAAVFSRGIWHWDGKKMHQYGIAQGLSEDVRFAYEPEPGQLWVGARFGIFARRPDGRFEPSLTLPSGFVYAFQQGPDGRHYALTSAYGIYRLENSGWQPVATWNSRLPSTNVRGLLFRSDGTVYVATLSGVKIFDRSDRVVETGAAWVKVPEAVNALLEYRGEVYFAGYGGLVVCADPAGDCREVDPSLLPGRTLYSLAEAADGSLWVGGAAGVGRFADGRWTRFDAGSGLIEDECNHFGLLARPDGQVLVGTMASLARFEPRSALTAGPPLALHWLGNPATDQDGKSLLPAEERNLSLRWHAPWLLPRQLEYRVRIPRLRETWLPPQKENFRHLENLGPGEWQVEVAARILPGGDWTEPLRHTFVVPPRFVETNVFRLLCGVALLLAIAGLVHLRTRSLERRARELQTAVEKHVASLKTLQGLLPICASCKKIRDDHGYWQQLESFLRAHSEAELSHGFCPDCFERITSALDATHPPDSPSVN